MIIANIEDYRKQCESRLPPFLYDYISGGSFQENTLRANIAELQATLLRQRVMVDESNLNLSIRLWDQAMSLPVVGNVLEPRRSQSGQCGEGGWDSVYVVDHGGVRCERGRAKERHFPLGSSSICSKTAVSSKA